MIISRLIPSDDFDVTMTVTFCFDVARAQVEGKTPFDVAALVKRRLDTNNCFVLGAKLELETADRTEFRAAWFGLSEGGVIAGLFSGDESPSKTYLRNVPPEERTTWSFPEVAEPEG